MPAHAIARLRGLWPLAAWWLLGCDPASAQNHGEPSSAVSGLRVSAPALDIAVPDFALTDQDGRSVKRADLEGKVWVASFFFTSCPVVCPELIQRQAKLKDELLANEDVRFVSISVDAENDTPDKLRAFAAKHGAVHERWLFLTGEPKQVDALVLNGFKMALQKSPAASAISISHAERFALLDRRAHLRAVFDSDDAGRQALATRVRELVAE